MKLILAMVFARVGMAIPTIVIGLALPSHFNRGTWAAPGVLALIYAVVAWRYPTLKAHGLYSLLLLALTDIMLTALELRSDLSTPISGQRAAFAASLTLDILQLIPALIVVGVISWQLYQYKKSQSILYYTEKIIDFEHGTGDYKQRP